MLKLIVINKFKKYLKLMKKTRSCYNQDTY